MFSQKHCASTFAAADCLRISVCVQLSDELLSPRRSGHKLRMHEASPTKITDGFRRGVCASSVLPLKDFLCPFQKFEIKKNTIVVFFSRTTAFFSVSLSGIWTLIPEDMDLFLPHDIHELGNYHFK